MALDEMKKAYAEDEVRERIAVRERARLDAATNLAAARREERRDMLGELLTEKFGPLPARARVQIATATASDLAVLLKRVVTADSLADVFSGL